MAFCKIKDCRSRAVSLCIHGDYELEYNCKEHFDNHLGNSTLHEIIKIEPEPDCVSINMIKQNLQENIQSLKNDRQKLEQFQANLIKTIKDALSFLDEKIRQSCQLIEFIN